jgi:hypothetical protein
MNTGRQMEKAFPSQVLGPESQAAAKRNRNAGQPSMAGFRIDRPPRSVHLALVVHKASFGSFGEADALLKMRDQ